MRSANRWRPAWLGLQVLFAAAVLWYAGRELWRQSGAAGQALAAIDVRWGAVALSCVLVLAAYAVLIQTWRLMLRVWGADLPAGSAARIWFVSNLGRYIPGKIWQISAMGAMTLREGISPVAATSASIMVNLVNIVAGVLVVFATGAGMLDLAAPGGKGVAVALLVVAAVGVVSVPTLVSWGARRLEGLTGRSVAPTAALTPRASMLGLAGTTAAWVLYGLAFHVFARGVLGRAAEGGSADYIAAYTASYLVGYLALFAPGGLGVREAMLVIALRVSGVMAEPNGWILAIASRVWLTALEVLPGVGFLAAGARLRFREPDAQP